MRSRYPDRGSALEYYLWIFTRLSGVLILSMGAFAIAYNMLAGGRTLMDAPTHYRWAFFPTYWHVRNYGLMTANPFGISHFVGKKKDGTRTEKN